MYVRKLNYWLHEAHTEGAALQRFSLQGLLSGAITYQFVCSDIYLFTQQHLNLAQCTGMREIFASGIRILGFGIGNTAQGIQNPTS